MGMRGALSILVLATAPVDAAGQDDCFGKVIEFSEGICAEFVRLDGQNRSLELDGTATAKLSGIFKAITDVGGEFGGSISQEEYTNILREDIPDALESGRQCRLEVAKLFFDKICGSSSDGADDSTFPLRAQIDDPDGYTNVRSGAGPGFSVSARVLSGEIFYTRIQPGSWWQVRTADGVVGYMHLSRIRVLP
jgi:hypothetical protein